MSSPFVSEVSRRYQNFYEKLFPDPVTSEHDHQSRRSEIQVPRQALLLPACWVSGHDQIRPVYLAMQ